MNCESAKANITFYVYDELGDDARFELERHLEHCVRCAAELKTMRELREQMSAVSVEEPSPNLLAASRLRLQEGLEGTHPQSRGVGWHRFTLDLAGWMQQVRFSPALAAVLLMIGFGGGVFATYRIFANPGGPPGPQVTSESTIAGIRSILEDPASKRVTINYDTLQAQSAQGSVEDPRIQQLLFYAARSQYNSGMRMDSVDLLARRPEDDRVRQLLIYALRHDANTGVRLKALDALQPYIKSDVNVRNAVLAALVNDPNAGVRSEAIDLLRPVKADSSVRQVLEALAQHDKNKFIRLESQHLLGSMPELY